MRGNNFPEQHVDKFNWKVLKALWPYLLEFKVRIAFALGCLILTKVASVYLRLLHIDLQHRKDYRYLILLRYQV